VLFFFSNSKGGLQGAFDLEWADDLDFTTLEILPTPIEFHREGSSGGPDPAVIKSMGSSDTESSSSSFEAAIQFVASRLGYHAEPTAVAGASAAVRQFASTYGVGRAIERRRLQEENVY